MITSKGMAGVPGSAFLALSATASALGVVPAGAVALLLGVDRVMDAMRVATDLLGTAPRSSWSPAGRAPSAVTAPRRR
jgi:aerobic C4-dicarboxylate transport protein